MLLCLAQGFEQREIGGLARPYPAKESRTSRAPALLGRLERRCAKAPAALLHLGGAFEERQVGNVVRRYYVVKESRTFQAPALLGRLERRCAEAPTALQQVLPVAGQGFADGLDRRAAMAAASAAGCRGAKEGERCVRSRRF